MYVLKNIGTVEYPSACKAATTQWVISGKNPVEWTTMEEDALAMSVSKNDASQKCHGDVLKKHCSWSRPEPKFVQWELGDAQLFRDWFSTPALPFGFGNSEATLSFGTLALGFAMARKCFFNGFFSQHHGFLPWDTFCPNLGRSLILRATHIILERSPVVVRCPKPQAHEGYKSKKSSEEPMHND